MRSHLRLFLWLLVILAVAGKYVFVRKYEYWNDALDYCRTHYTDLAPIASEYDTHILRQISGNYVGHAWFGLLRNTSDPSKWMWSGGGEATVFYWDVGQPKAALDQKYGQMIDFRWHNVEYYKASYFFCYSVRVVREEKTWDEALEHCRKHHEDLASISSETEAMSIQNEQKKHVSTEHVWIGLRFLSREWLWMDGHEGEYEGWGEGAKPECPGEDLSCGALRVNSVGAKLWKARDCQEKLHFVCF